MTSYQQAITENVRLAILQALAEDAGYSHNQNIIQMILERLGHNLTIDQVRTQLRWLEEQGLLEIETVSDLLVAKMTQRGLDIAKGHGRVDGIARPRP